MPEALLDNDVLIKGACYCVLDEVLAGFGGDDSVGVLGAAKFVVSGRLARDPRVQDRERAVAHWIDFLTSVQVMEPSEDAVTVAVAIEEAAAKLGLSLDAGESQLVAIALLHPVPRFVTGDKRAIAALEGTLPVVERLRELAGRVVCLEQLIGALAARYAGDALAEMICRESEMDKALAICFRCAGKEKIGLDVEGLDSYVGEVRHRAATLLADDLRFLS